MMGEKLLSGDYRGARNLVKATAARLMLTLSHYLWLHSNPELPKAHSDDPVLSPGCICYLRDTAGHFWTKVKLCEVICLIRSSGGWDSHCVVRCSIPAGGQDHHGHPKFRNVFLLRHVTSLSKPIVSGQKRREKNFDLDSSYWADFIHYVGDKPLDDSLDRTSPDLVGDGAEVKSGEGYFSEPYPELGRLPAEDLIRESNVHFDQDSGLFKLHLSDGELESIFARESERVSDDHFLELQEVRQQHTAETPDKERMTRRKAKVLEEEQNRFEGLDDAVGKNVGALGAKPKEEDVSKLEAIAVRREEEARSAEILPALGAEGKARAKEFVDGLHLETGRLISPEEMNSRGGWIDPDFDPEEDKEKSKDVDPTAWRRSKKYHRDIRSKTSDVKFWYDEDGGEHAIDLLASDEEATGHHEKDLDYIRDHHDKLFVAGAATPLRRGVKMRSGDLILDQSVWPKKTGTFYFSKDSDGVFEKVKSRKLVSKNKKKLYELKIGRLYYYVPLVAGDSNWSIPRPRKEVLVNGMKRTTWWNGQMLAVVMVILILLGVLDKSEAEEDGNNFGKLFTDPVQTDSSEMTPIEFGNFTWGIKVRWNVAEQNTKHGVCVDMTRLPAALQKKLRIAFP